MTNYFPGDLNIDYCNMISPRGLLDLTESFLSARIYESIFTPNCMVEIDVFDTDDTISNLQISGDEQINLSITVPGCPTAAYTFALDKVSLDDITGTQKGKKFTLYGVGKETMQAKTNYIQKAYNTDITSIIGDIHNTFLKSINTLFTEATQGIQNIIIPNMKPFDAIDMVRRRATSSENPSSTFLYFENSDGHNFKTIEGMMKQGNIKTYTHGDAFSSSVFNNNFYNLISYQVPQIISTSSRIDLGGLTQRVATFDIRTRQYVYNDVTPPNMGFNSSYFQSLYGAVFGLFSFIPQDSAARASTNIPQTTPFQMSYLSNLMQRYVNCQGYGDTNVKAGTTVYLDIPQAITTTGPQISDPIISGSYLVSRLCRNIDVLGTKPRYCDVMELLSGNMNDPVS